MVLNEQTTKCDEEGNTTNVSVYCTPSKRAFLHGV